MRISPSGNVGIGTTSPYAKLSVVGPVVAEYFHATSTAATTTLAGGLNVGSGAVTYDFSSGLTSIQNLALGAMSFDTDAGIVSWADMPVTSAASAGTVMSYSAQIAGTSTLTVYAESTGSGGAQNFRVGVGTSTPWKALSVSGTVGFDGLTGTTGAGSLCLTSNREVVYNSASNDCLASLRDTKHDIAELTILDAAGAARSGTSTIAALKPVSFVYNWDVSSTTRWGFIAEEVFAVSPRLVTYDAKGEVSGLDNYGFTATIVKALKELIAQVQGFADRFVSDEITARNQLCIGSTCVTEMQLQALLAGAAVSPSAGSSGSPTPEQEQQPDTEPPVITINGNNPAIIQVGDTYNDLGAIVTDNVDQNLGYKTFVGSTPFEQAFIDTSEPNEWSIHFVATDAAGNTATSTRTVIVEAPSVIPAEEPEAEEEPAS